MFMYALRVSEMPCRTDRPTRLNERLCLKIWSRLLRTTKQNKVLPSKKVNNKKV